MNLSRTIKTLAVRAGAKSPPALRQLANQARGIETPRLLKGLPGDSLLVVAPHPDDEVLGAGGAIQLHLTAGKRVGVVYLTSGESTVGLVDRPEADRLVARRAEALASSEILGLAAGDLHFLGLPDGRLPADDSDPGLAPAVDALAEILQGCQADLVLVTPPFDAHRDHRAAALMVSRLPWASLPGVEVGLYEVWTPIAPNAIVDITAQLDNKLDALKKHVSALVAMDYCHTSAGLAAYRSAQGMRGQGAGEAFALLAPTGLAELIGQLQ